MSRYCYMTLHPSAFRCYDNQKILQDIKKVAPFCMFLSHKTVYENIEGKRYYERIRNMIRVYRLKNPFGKKVSYSSYMEFLNLIIKNKKNDLIFTGDIDMENFDQINIKKLTDYDDKYFKRRYKIPYSDFKNQIELDKYFRNTLDRMLSESSSLIITDQYLLKHIRSSQETDWAVSAMNKFFSWYFEMRGERQGNVRIKTQTHRVNDLQSKKDILTNALKNIFSDNNNFNFELKFEEVSEDKERFIIFNNKYYFRIDWGFDTFVYPTAEQNRNQKKLDFDFNLVKYMDSQ